LPLRRTERVLFALLRESPPEKALSLNAPKQRIWSLIITRLRPQHSSRRIKKSLRHRSMSKAASCNEFSAKRFSETENALDMGVVRPCGQVQPNRRAGSNKAARQSRLTSGSVSPEIN